MLKWFGSHRRLGRSAHNLYGSIVTAARQPALFSEYGVPDTVEGRFELLLAHLFLVLERLRREGGSEAALAQNLVDVFFADMDTSVRELGVGDMAVPKKMRNLATVVKERLAAYRVAMDSDDASLLAGLAAETVVSDGPAGAGASFAAYMRRCQQALERQPVEILRNAAPDVSLVAGVTISGRQHS